MNQALNEPHYENKPDYKLKEVLEDWQSMSVFALSLGVETPGKPSVHFNLQIPDISPSWRPFQSYKEISGKTSSIRSEDVGSIELWGGRHTKDWEGVPLVLAGPLNLILDRPTFLDLHLPQEVDAGKVHHIKLLPGAFVEVVGAHAAELQGPLALHLHHHPVQHQTRTTHINTTFMSPHHDTTTAPDWEDDDHSPSTQDDPSMHPLPSASTSTSSSSSTSTSSSPSFLRDVSRALLLRAQHHHQARAAHSSAGDQSSAPSDPISVRLVAPTAIKTATLSDISPHTSTFKTTPRLKVRRIADGVIEIGPRVRSNNTSALENERISLYKSHISLETDGLPGWMWPLPAVSFDSEGAKLVDSVLQSTLSTETGAAGFQSQLNLLYIHFKALQLIQFQIILERPMEDSDHPKISGEVIHYEESRWNFTCAVDLESGTVSPVSISAVNSSAAGLTEVQTSLRSSYPVRPTTSFDRAVVFGNKTISEFGVDLGSPYPEMLKIFL